MLGKTEQEIKSKAIEDAGRITLLAVMGLNRADRRRLAKINGIKKFEGKNIPYVKEKKA